MIETRFEKYKDLRKKIQEDIEFETKAIKTNEKIQNYSSQLLRIDPHFFNVDVSKVKDIQLPMSLKQQSLSISKGNNIKNFLYKVNKSELISMNEKIENHLSKHNYSLSTFSDIDSINSIETQDDKTISNILLELDKSTNEMQIQIQTEIEKMKFILEKLTIENKERNHDNLTIELVRSEKDYNEGSKKLRILSSSEYDISETLKLEIQNSAHKTANKDLKKQAILIIITLFFISFSVIIFLFLLKVL